MLQEIADRKRRSCRIVPPNSKPLHNSTAALSFAGGRQGWQGWTCCCAHRQLLQLGVVAGAEGEACPWQQPLEEDCSQGAALDGVRAAPELRTFTTGHVSAVECGHASAEATRFKPPATEISLRLHTARKVQSCVPLPFPWDHDMQAITSWRYSRQSEKVRSCAMLSRYWKASAT